MSGRVADRSPGKAPCSHPRLDNNQRIVKEENVWTMYDIIYRDGAGPEPRSSEFLLQAANCSLLYQVARGSVCD